MTNVIKAVSPLVRTVAEVKKKWFLSKVMPKKKKKRTAAHNKGHKYYRRESCTTSVSSLEEIIVANFVESTLKGFIPNGENKSATPATTEEAGSVH